MFSGRSADPGRHSRPDFLPMEFPALSLREAIEAFTEAAYGERLSFEHA